MFKVCKIGIGWGKSFTSWRAANGPLNLTVKPTNREVWGARRSADDVRERLTESGADPDRSIYAWISDERPLAFRHSRGKESNVVRQCWQTAVASIKSRFLGKNTATCAKISEGSQLMGVRQFFAFLILLSIAGILSIASSICNKPMSGIGSCCRPLIKPLRPSQRFPCCQADELVSFLRPSPEFLTYSISNFPSIASRSRESDESDSCCTSGIF